VVRIGLGVLLAVLLAAPAQAQDRFALAGGCYALTANGAQVAKTADGGYRAGGGQGERFRLQATALGRYLLYGTGRDFLGQGRGPLPISPERPQSATAPSETADWQVDVVDGAYVLKAAGRALAVDGNGMLVLAASGSRFGFEPATGCADYPEAETNVSGEPTRGATPFGEVRGLLDAHMHMMAFEFLGGRVHCGRPWHPYGVASALVDCPDHEPMGAGAIGENVLSYGNPVGTHDTRGWPTLKDWPHHASLTHEQTYYRWLERSYRGGLRLMVNLLVDNEVLCALYPYKKNSCNEMDGVRLQARRLRELQDYIDAQSGGPGKGWFRIVTDPFEARRAINAGKLAVVMGIEVSKLFDCGVQDGQPECTAEQIDQRLKEVYELGVRDMELVNKFDNALGGVAGDSGTTGVVVNLGNRFETGRFWQMGQCDDPHNHDKAQPTAPGVPDRDQLAGNLLHALLPPGAAPLYGEPPHCNELGLSPLGAHLVTRMMERGMVIDPDHLSWRARQQLLDLVEQRGYSGVVSSHSWSTPDAIPRILRLGGVVTPMAGSTTDFAAAWRETRKQRDPRFYWGIGWGADMNGFASQGGPRQGGNVSYPFRSFDGHLVDRQRSGQRVYDINVDGVAHYGLFPDWVEDLRLLAGQDVVDDLGRGAEAYLQMWERAVGVPMTRCEPRQARATRRGLGRVKLRARTSALLRRAGQPRVRTGRIWRWCRVTARLTRGGKVSWVRSTSPRHRALGARPGRKLSDATRRRTHRVAPGVRGRGRIRIGVRDGRVRWIGATTAR
jgi:microsomal dipeptidase-like Zn-dependent dipeptidase